MPCHSTGRNGSGGALRRTAQTVSASGACATKLRYCRRTWGASAKGCTISPARTCGPRGCSGNSKLVTTPKLPPPPRNAQNRSGFTVAPTWCNWPSARTISTPVSASTDIPKARVIQLNPPPSVRPATPVVELMPIGAVSQNACVSRSKSASVASRLTQAFRPAGSTVTERICDRSISSAPSATALPAI